MVSVQIRIPPLGPNFIMTMNNKKISYISTGINGNTDLQAPGFGTGTYGMWHATLLEQLMDINVNEKGYMKCQHVF